MNNYHYIITGLPVLSPDFEPSAFSYEETAREIVPMLSEKDRKILKWLDFGSDVEHLNLHFYNGAIRSRNRFISQYFAFDRNVRNAQVEYLSRQNGQDAQAYAIGECDHEFEEYPRLKQILEIRNLIEREQELDRLRWNKISEIVTYDYFNLNTILAFLAKGRIIERWNRLDKKKGAGLFRQLVQDVRGTFKGVEF